MIYFLQAFGGGPVKIGYSDNVAARHKQLESRYGCPLVLLSAIEGAVEEEAEIHRRFAHIRLPGEGTRGCQPEQFLPTSELAEFIGSDKTIISDEADLMRTVRDEFDGNGVRMKVDKSLAGKAKLIAAHEGISIADLVSELLQGPIDKRYAKMLRDLESNP